MKGAALFETMTRQVDAECESNRAAAAAEGSAIAADARSRSSAGRDATLKATDAEMAMLDERARQKASAEAARADLSMKNDVVQEALSKVQNEIARITASDAFPGILETLLAQVMEVVEGEEGIVVLAPEKHVDEVRAWLAANGHADTPVDPSAEVATGVAVQDPGRTWRVSNTLRGRYTRAEQEARRLCMTSLFGRAAAEGKA